MTKNNNHNLFFETPKDKMKVFQDGRLVMLSNGLEVESWNNIQPIYFYPFSWLDYLGKESIRELFIMQDCSHSLAEREIYRLDKGKVQFESFDKPLIRLAKKRGHRVSVIGNIEDLTIENARGLEFADFVRIRVGKKVDSFQNLSLIPRQDLLSCIKVYAGEGCEYSALATEVKSLGFDLIHVSKRLVSGKSNLQLNPSEVDEISKLKSFEDDHFKVHIPSSLEERFARRFVIDSSFSNSSLCSFSAYRRVLSREGTFPCYTEVVLIERQIPKIGPGYNCQGCKDCACIYENDMLSDIKSKMKGRQNITFALEYKPIGGKSK